MKRNFLDYIGGLGELSLPPIALTMMFAPWLAIPFAIVGAILFIAWRMDLRKTTAATNNRGTT